MAIFSARYDILRVFLVVTIVFYQLVVARWLHETFGRLLHYGSKIFLYGMHGLH